VHAFRKAKLARISEGPTQFGRQSHHCPGGWPLFCSDYSTFLWSLSSLSDISLPAQTAASLLFQGIKMKTFLLVLYLFCDLYQLTINQVQHQANVPEMEDGSVELGDDPGVSPTTIIWYHRLFQYRNAFIWQF
jgi:hypothetical protein